MNIEHDDRDEYCLVMNERELLVLVGIIGNMEDATDDEIPSLIHDEIVEALDERGILPHEGNIEIEGDAIPRIVDVQ